MDSSKYISLLVKKFKGKLSDPDSEALDRWLASEEHKDSARQFEKAWDLSRQYKSGYEPDVEAGLARFKKRISQEAEPVGSAKVIDLPRRRFSLAWVAAIAVLVLALGWWWKNSNTSKIELIATTQGEQKEVKLPDGSIVILNESSEIDFSNFAKDQNRTVQFSGEAYFDIVPDPDHPFIILTNDAEVKVLGTSFNLRAYQSESFTEVEVESGLVELREKSTPEPLLLKAKDRGVCTKEGGLSSEKVDYLNALSWRTQSLAFRNTPLEEVIPYLERHFKIRIRLEETLRKCPITSDFKKINRDTVFLTLEKLFNAQVEQLDPKQFVVKGNGC